MVELKPLLKDTNRRWYLLGPRKTSIRLVKICPNFRFLVPTAVHVWFPPWSMEEEVWWCEGAWLVTLSVIYLEFKAHNMHGYHSILQRYAIPSGLRYHLFFNRTMTQSTPPGFGGLFDQEGEWWSAALDELSSTITRPQPNWDGLGWAPHEADWENAKSVQSCHQGKGWLLWII
jgi:hypothetical protein